MRLNERTGFTLIEIMLVVIIIGILAAVVLPRFVGRTEEARRAAALTQIENIGLALDQFELDNGRFPATLDELVHNPGNIPNWKGPYLKKDVPNDPWGNPYYYKSPGTKNPDYDLESFGPDGVEGGGDDIPSLHQSR